MSKDPELLIDDEPPKKSVAQQRAAEKLAASLQRVPHYTEFRKPVPVMFLAQIMGKQVRQIQKRLEKCPIKEMKGNTAYYDFWTAVAYLVPPKGNIEDWFGQQNAASLPPFVNKMWWDSAHQRNRVMLDSNDLWHSQDVAVVMGRVAMLIMSHTNMWIENLPNRDDLTAEQYNALVDSKNEMLRELKEILISQPRQTLSMTSHIQSELDTSTLVTQVDHGDE